MDQSLKQRVDSEGVTEEALVGDWTESEGPPTDSDNSSDLRAVDEIARAREAIRTEIGKRIVGQWEVVDQLLISLFSRGHCLFVGVPGLAKTLLISTLAESLNLHFQRIQFTPDLMPSDITGTDVLEEDHPTGKRIFRFIHGPIFTNLLLADEINRTPPKTQAALLQAMQEYQVTAGGQTFDLARPFQVFATQNPIEQEGTYPLPEAQLDRFIVQVPVEYPDRDTERDILIATTGADEAASVQVFDAAALLHAQKVLRRMPVGEGVVEMILDLVRACRPGEAEALPVVNASVSWGPGPRAAQALMLTVRARALLDGRLAPSAEDVAALAWPVLGHRMALSFAARARGETLEAVIDAVGAEITRTEAAA